MEGRIPVRLINMTKTHKVKTPIAPPVTASELRQFGLLFGAILVALFGVLLPWFFNHSFPRWPWIIASLLCIISLTVPSALQPFYRIWMRFGLIAGYINTRIIMFALYYGVFVPIGALMSVMGRDALSHKATDHSQDSYRVASIARPRDHFERPY